MKVITVKDCFIKTNSSQQKNAKKKEDNKKEGEGFPSPSV